MIDNTNRDIRRFETDGDGNTTRVLLNTDEPLGLLEGDLQAQIDALTERLNSIVGLDNVVKITHGGTGQTGTVAAMEALTTGLGTDMFSSDYAKFLLKRVDGAVVLQTIEEVIDILDGLKASNNLSDLSNTLTGLQNLYHNVPEAATQGGIPLKNWFDSLRVMLGHRVSEGGGSYRTEPNYYVLKDLVDNYLSEYFLMKSNNLSELSSANDAIKNLLSEAQSLSSQIANGDEIMIDNAGMPPSSPRTGGKITLLQLFNYILDGLNTEYGMTKDSQTNLYEFTGNAATADTATSSLGLSMSGGSVNMALKAAVSPLQTLSGDGTVVFSSSNDDFGTEDVILGFGIVVDGAGGAVINSFTQERVQSAQSAGSLTVTVNVTGNTVGMGNPSSFYVYCYYLHDLNS